MSMDTIELIFTWGVPLLLLYVLYQNKKELVHFNAMFQQLAKRNKGTLSRRTWFDYPMLTINDNGFEFCVGVSLAPGGNVWVTRLNMSHQQRIDFELYVQLHSRLEKMATDIGFQDAAVGSKHFNDSFLVKSSDDTKARVFMTEDLQQALLKLRGLSPELTFTKSAIVLTTSFLNNASDYQMVVDFARLLCTRLQAD